MTDEYLPAAELSVAMDGEETETVLSNKDESMTTSVNENGYESECSSSSRSEEEVTASALEVEADAFTRFIERQRMEVMFELRRLRLGERPVTGQPNREQIETFFSNAQEEQQQQEVRLPATRPAAPSAHMADIDALASRRCVSAALSSAAFRQDLENAVRFSIGNRATQQAPPASRVPAPTVVAQPPRQVIQTVPPVAVERQPTNIQRQERELNAWQAITELQRERIVVEISDLVHRQLVTSALESDFRHHLERNVLNHMARGAPLQHEQQQQVAPAAVARPLILPQIPRTNAHVADANLDTITTRLDSMQQMLQMMFTMQMDMQRSLRQEVASALANNATTTPIPPAQPAHAGHCTVCLTAMADTVLYRCGHLCVCYTCGLQLQQSTSVYGVKCPICRAPVEDILRVYRSSRDGE